MKHVRREDFLLKAHFAAAKILFFFRAQGFSYRVKMRHNRNNNKNNYLLRSLRTCFIGENVRTFPFHFDVYDEEHFFLLHYFYRNIEKRKSMIKTCCTSTRYHTIPHDIMQKYKPCDKNTTIYLVCMWRRHNGIEMGLLKREQNAF